MHPIKEYFNASAARLTNEARSAGITGHPSDTGANREDILLNWLNRHTPSRLTCILGGKVLGLNQGLSRQIDCMVVSDIAPRFQLHDRSICIVESMAMAISVKSTLDKAQLHDSLVNLSSIPQLSEQVIGETASIRRQGHFQKLTACIPALIVWAYQSLKADTIHHHLLQWILENPRVPTNRLPIAIIVNEQFIIRRTLAPATLSDGTVVPANTWKSSSLDDYPGYGLSTLVNDLVNAVSWLNDLSVQFYPYSNEALDA